MNSTLSVRFAIGLLVQRQWNQKEPSTFKRILRDGNSLSESNKDGDQHAESRIRLKLTLGLTSALLVTCLLGDQTLFWKLWVNFYMHWWMRRSVFKGEKKWREDGKLSNIYGRTFCHSYTYNLHLHLKHILIWFSNTLNKTWGKIAKEISLLPEASLLTTSMLDSQ